MPKLSKSLSAALAGQAGEATYVDDVFSTYVRTGTGDSPTITNGINLADEGGLVWCKSRSQAYDHNLFDTERGTSKKLVTNSTDAEGTISGVTAFNSDGFTLGDSPNVDWAGSAYTYAYWTFRKAPGFFDVVTYTGDGTVATNRHIPHNLGCVPGFIVIKRLDGATNWEVNALNSSGTYERLRLNLASATSGTQTGHTSTTFHTITNSMNTSGAEYVAYLFADGDDAAAQIFGTDGDQAVVKCGSYTGNSSNDGPEIDLGFEPQFLIIKAAERTANWFMWDTMRGFTAPDVANSPLYPNLSNAEYTGTTYVAPTSTGFKITDSSNDVNSGLAGYNQYIYIAIRRPHKPAESGTEVFAIDTRSGTPPSFVSNFPVDMGIWKDTDGSSGYIADRLRGAVRSKTDSTNAESAAVAYRWDYQNGYYESTTADTTIYSWMFKRSPGFFDVVCYTGDGSTSDIPHNLGVTPELMIVKNRDLILGSYTYDWNVYHKDLGSGYNRLLYLNDNGAAFTNTNVWVNNPSSTTFTVGVGEGEVNYNGNSYIAYLFASQDGISKVFSVTKSSGSNADVNCGFSSGARFVMLKRTDSTGDWYVWDTERGIVAGNDPYLLLNSTAAENTSTDYIDPLSTGFTIVDGGLANGDYIGLAVS